MSRTGFDDTGLHWVAVELISGDIICEVPVLQVNLLEYHMQESSTVQANLPYDTAPRHWVDWTVPYTHALLLLQDGVCVWGGIIVKRLREAAHNYTALTLCTVEEYLNRVYVTDCEFQNTQQTVIAQRLVDSAILGNRFSFKYDVRPSQYYRDRSYYEKDDKTVFERLKELAGVINGIEYYCDWQPKDVDGWQPCLHVADFIGSRTPVTSFDKSTLSSFSVLEDYSSGYGANRVLASSTAEGDIRPESAWHESSGVSRPVVQRKFQPSSNITSVETLDEHAQAELQEIENGTTTISFESSLSSMPRIGKDWQLGDTIRWIMSDSSYPDYTEGLARIIGYKLSFSDGWKFTPTLQKVAA